MAKSKSKGRSRGAAIVSNKAGPPTIVEDEFGNYRIKAGRLSGNFVARAFPKGVSKTQGLMAEAFGASESEAIDALKKLLSERNVQQKAARRWDPESRLSIPSREEFIEALQQTKLSATQLSMLKAQALAGEQGLTAVSLMRSAGYKSPEFAIKVLSRTGSIVADFLGVDYLKYAMPNQMDAARVIGFRRNVEEDEPGTWIMHEELRHAVWATL